METTDAATNATTDATTDATASSAFPTANAADAIFAAIADANE